MLEPRDKGIILWTLRYGDEVRDPNDYFGKIGEVKFDSSSPAWGSIFESIQHGPPALK